MDEDILGKVYVAVAGQLKGGKAGRMMFVVHLSLHVAMKNRTFYIAYVSFPLFPFPLVAQKLFSFLWDSHSNVHL